MSCGVRKRVREVVSAKYDDEKVQGAHTVDWLTDWESVCVLPTTNTTQQLHWRWRWENETTFRFTWESFRSMAGERSQQQRCSHWNCKWPPVWAILRGKLYKGKTHCKSIIWKSFDSHTHKNRHFIIWKLSGFSGNHLQLLNKLFSVKIFR